MNQSEDPVVLLRRAIALIEAQREIASYESECQIGPGAVHPDPDVIDDILKRHGVHHSQRVVVRGVWWCETHNRLATHKDKNGRRACDPKLAGITIPCKVVFVDE